MSRLLLTTFAIQVLLAPAVHAQDQPEEVPEEDDDVQDILDEDLDEDTDPGDESDGGYSPSPALKGSPPPDKKGWGWNLGDKVDWDSSFSEEVEDAPAVFTPSRQSEEPFHASAAVDLVTEMDMEEVQAATTTQALFDLPGVFLVQPTAAGSSPVMRGLLGQRISLLFDGIRLGHATVNPGPSLLAGHVDPMNLSAIEVLRGPSLVMAGPMAIGGVVNFMPALPFVNPLVSYRAQGSVSYRYGSADNSHVLHGEVDFQIHDTAVSAGLSFGSFSTLQSGNDRQPYTEYGSLSFDLAVRKALGLTSDLLFYFGTTRLGQAYMPVEGPAAGTKDFMRWPQLDRNLLYMRYSAEEAGPFETLQLTLGIQMFDERPQHFSESATIPSTAVWDKQILHSTSAFALFWNRAPLGGWGSLLTGVDYYLDLVDAQGRSQQTQGAAPPEVADLERPVLADGTMVHMLEPMAMLDIYALQPFMLSVGGRLWYHDLERGDGHDAKHLVGGSTMLSGRYPLGDLAAFVLNASYGTRPPTMYEYAGQTCAPMRQVVSPDIEPEGIFGAELGTKWNLGVIEGSLFYGFTLIHDMLIPVEAFPETVPEQCAATPSDWYSWQNEATGLLHSIEFQNRVNVKEFLTIGTILTYQHGTQKQGSVKQPMALIPPLSGTVFVTMRYPRQYLWGDVRLRFAIKQDRLPDGTVLVDSEKDPFFLLSVRGGLDLGKNLRLYVAFENLVNQVHRWYGSSIDGPGRSVFVGIEGRL
ncbi:MAG: TonB-dependent receptor [Deltaproteobacteria bacterium]|nr:TonB-dependent receptor [Deltaproteobacteria bacterium]